MMRRIIFLLAALVAPAAWAAGGGALPYSFEPDLSNKSSMQRGAKLYMNYCAGCHSLQYLRYSRMAEDLDIPEEVVEANLRFTGEKIQNHLTGVMPEASANWFGKQPPDLTLVTRWHKNGPSWVYSFLRTFYVDESTANGTNNLVLENTAMPHVLWPLQGYQALDEDHGESSGGHGGHGPAAPAFTQVREGSMSEQEYAQAVGDLVNFLTYAGEPARLHRAGLGIKVIAFLLIFALIAYLLKREYWRDVH